MNGTNQSLLLGQGNYQQKEGERFLQFSLQGGIKALIALADLHGTMKISLQDILPVPQVAEFWLGIINWQGEAIWIVDLGALMVASHWCNKDTILPSGMAILIEIEGNTIGLLVEQVNGIETYEPRLCLPMAEINYDARLKDLFKGYFLGDSGESYLVFDTPSLNKILH